jgi:glucose-1-phosphate thymidylyltransferase
MLDQGLKMRVETVEVWKDCGKPDALLETNRYLLDHRRDNAPNASQRQGAIIVPPVFIDPTATLSEAVIGPHASIGPGCVIQRSIVSDSIVEAGALVQESILVRSIIGREARVVGQSHSLNIGDHSTIEIN